MQTYHYYYRTVINDTVGDRNSYPLESSKLPPPHYIIDRHDSTCRNREFLTLTVLLTRSGLSEYPPPKILRLKH